MLSPMKRAAAIEIETDVLTLHQAAAGDGVVLCAALPMGEGDDVPEFIHLLPAGEIRTGDGRGPYTIKDIQALCAESLTAGDRLVLDENHSTDLAAPKGEPAPARGWIIELQSRADGIWGKVEWTDEGRKLVASKAYRAISPVLRMDGNSNRVKHVLRASLVNRANLEGLQTLHQENAMNPLLAKLIEKLGLKTDTSEETLLAHVVTLHQAQTDQQTLHAQLATAVGLKPEADRATILGAVTTLKAGANGVDVVALQQQLVDVTTQLNTLSEGTARDKATAFVDKAIADRRVGVAAQREHYITRHMKEASVVEGEILKFPTLNASHTHLTPPADDKTGGALDANDRETMHQLGLTEEQFLAARKKETA